MTPTPVEILENSLIYRSVIRVRDCAAKSSLVSALSNEDVVAGIAGVFLLFSVVRVLASDVHVTIQFLSFALLFVAITAVTWNYTEPLADA